MFIPRLLTPSLLVGLILSAAAHPVEQTRRGFLVSLLGGVVSLKFDPTETAAKLVVGTSKVKTASDLGMYNQSIALMGRATVLVSLNLQDFARREGKGLPTELSVLSWEGFLGSVPILKLYANHNESLAAELRYSEYADKAFATYLEQMPVNTTIVDLYRMAYPDLPFDNMTVEDLANFALSVHSSETNDDTEIQRVRDWLFEELTRASLERASLKRVSPVEEPASSTLEFVLPANYGRSLYYEVSPLRTQVNILYHVLGMQHANPSVPFLPRFKMPGSNAPVTTSVPSAPAAISAPMEGGTSVSTSEAFASAFKELAEKVGLASTHCVNALEQIQRIEQALSASADFLNDDPYEETTVPVPISGLPETRPAEIEAQRPDKTEDN